jgi:hypothetical protein
VQVNKTTQRDFKRTTTVNEIQTKLMVAEIVKKIFLPHFSASRMFVIVYTGLCPEPA